MEEMDTSDILTFDELLEDDYYRSEFEKRLKQELDIKNSHPDLKRGGIIVMEKSTQPTDVKANDVVVPIVATSTSTATSTPRVAVVLQTPDPTLTPDPQPQAPPPEPTDPPQPVVPVVPQPQEVQPLVAPSQAEEVAALKAELALLKAGIIPERLEAARKLFLADGGEIAKAAEFAEKYPEWKAGASGVTLSKAPPVASKTAPNTINQPVYNDFERKVAAARKKAGLN